MTNKIYTKLIWIFTFIYLFAYTFSSLSHENISFANSNEKISKLESESKANFEEEFEEQILIELVNANAASVMAIVVKDGKTQNFFTRTLNNETEEISENSYIKLGGVSKILLSQGLLTLLNVKNISLNSEISKYLPENLSDKFKGLTFENILLHTSGIADYKFETEFIPNTNLPNPEFQDLGTFYNQMATEQLLRYKYTHVLPQNTRYLNSNINDILSEILINQISDVNAYEYLKQIFSSLNLKHTEATLSSDKSPIKSYQINAGTVNEHPKKYSKFLTDAVITNGQDIESLLGHFTTNENLLIRKFGDSAVSAGSGYGFKISRLFNTDVFENSDTSNGTSMKFVIIPRYKLGIFLYINTENSNVLDRLLTKILNLELNSIKPEEIKYTQLNVPKSLSGTYIPVSIANETPERFLEWKNSIKIATGNGMIAIGDKIYKPITAKIYHHEESREFLELTTDKSGRLEFIHIGDVTYKKAHFFSQPALQLWIFILFTTLTVVILIHIKNKWTTLKIRRTEDTQRFALLIITVLYILISICIIVVYNKYNVNSLTLGMNIFEIGLRYLSFTMVPAILYSIYLTKDAKGEYNWNFLVPMLKLNILMSIALFILIKYYHF